MKYGWMMILSIIVPGLIACGGGDDGAQTASGEVSIVHTEPASEADCPNGGTLVSVGADKDGNGVLNDQEVDAKIPVCDDGGVCTGAPLDLDVELEEAATYRAGVKYELAVEANAEDLDIAVIGTDVVDGEFEMQGSDGVIEVDLLESDHVTFTVLAQNGCQFETKFVDVGEVAVPPYKKLVAGRVHTCGLRLDGTVSCWGSAVEGSEYDEFDDAYITDVPDGSFVDLYAHSFFNCGLRADGTARCWGEYDEETAVNPEGEFTQLAPGFPYSCGIRPDGDLYCWSHRDESSNGKFDIAVEDIFDGDRAFAEIQYGRFDQFNIIARMEDDSLYAIDLSEFQRGGDEIAVKTPIFNGELIQDFDGSGDVSVCGIRGPENDLVCNFDLTEDAPWLDYAMNFDPGVEDNTPGAIAVATGEYHGAALYEDGTVRCVGPELTGELGAVAEESGDPCDIPEGLNFSTIAAGNHHVCGVTDDHVVHCWGRDHWVFFGSDINDISAIYDPIQ